MFGTLGALLLNFQARRDGFEEVLEGVLDVHDALSRILLWPVTVSDR